MFIKSPSLLFQALALALVLLFSSPAHAFTLEEYQFETPQQEAEFRELIAKLRCLVCQNESLSGSQAELAQDLRNEVYKMMRAGQSQDEIIDFLVARYGDFVLYEPPLRPSTYILWFGPFVLIGIGAFVLLRILMNRRASPDAALTPEDEARLASMLATTQDESRKNTP